MKLKRRPAAPPAGIPVVFVVDADASVRQALGSTICGAGCLPRFFASAEEFLACPREPTAGCVVLDLTLLDRYGRDLEELIADLDELPVICITREADVPTTVQAMKAGAFEFLTKPLREADLAGAITSAIDLSRSALTRAAELRPLRQRYASLSLREREVMGLVVQGRMNKLIAASLGISEVTVKAHRGKVMRKMAAQSLAHLVTINIELKPTAGAGNELQAERIARAYPLPVPSPELRFAARY
jgi:FixJ family two-component response regulator